MTPDIRIVPATEADVALILGFIRELAEYERLLHRVVATEERVRTALFGSHPFAEVIFAYDGDEPVGFALYFFTLSTFVGLPGLYLEDVFVRQAVRGKGIGRALLRHLARTARERGCGHMEWAVLDWNERAIRFYEGLGAEPMEGWTVYRLGPKALSSLAED
jgi:GNAT superfamily N-acetyltransferase